MHIKIFCMIEVFLSTKDSTERVHRREYNDVGRGGGGFCDRSFKGTMILGPLTDLIDMHDVSHISKICSGRNTRVSIKIYMLYNY